MSGFFDKSAQVHPVHGVIPAAAYSREVLLKAVLIVDRRTLFRDCMERSLKSHFPEVHVHGVDGFDEDARHGEAYDLAILGVEDVREATLRRLSREASLLAERQPLISIVLMTDDVDDGVTRSLASLKVAGIIPGNCSIEIMVAALRFALAGGTFGPVQEAPVLANPDGHQQVRSEINNSEIAQNSVPDPEEVQPTETGYSFTKREMEIIRHIHRGLQNKIIAHELNISESTVKVHLRNIMKKVHATNRTQVAMLLHNVFR